MQRSESSGTRSEVIQRVISDGIEEIGRFVTRTAFQRLLNELYALPHAVRARFVEEVVLNSKQLAGRGIETPDGLIIQRSTFADGRPTLFCVSKITPLAH